MLTVAQRNSLGALMTGNRGLGGEDVAVVEIPTGVPILCEIGADSRASLDH